MCYTPEILKVYLLNVDNMNNLKNPVSTADSGPSLAEKTILNVHLVSDSTGETVQAIARAAVAQFEDTQLAEHTHPFLSHVEQVDAVVGRIAARPGLTFFTIVTPEVREALVLALRRAGLPYVDVLGPVLETLTDVLQQQAKGRPGLQHVLDNSYFNRIDAMQYTLAHDDGQTRTDYTHADIILVGVSRTSKTPTSMYLANRGYRVANVPLVPGIPPPAALLETSAVVVGLTVSPDQLAEIRRYRLRDMNLGAQNEYVDYSAIQEEVRATERLIRQHNWPLLDVTRRSIEETAAAILDIAAKQGLTAPGQTRAQTGPKEEAHS